MNRQKSDAFKPGMIGGGEPASLLLGEVGGGDLYIFGAVLSLEYLGLMGSVVAFILYYQRIRSIGPWGKSRFPW